MWRARASSRGWCVAKSASRGSSVHLIIHASTRLGLSVNGATGGLARYGRARPSREAGTVTALPSAQV